MKDEKRFYVYEWFNVDTGEIFYVGKGTGYRYKDVNSRNKYFLNYYKKYDCNVRKVMNKLDESTAFSIEKELIKEYRDKDQCKCNLTDGGEGATFPEGSWNYWFRKLQFLHDVIGAMDDMIDEIDYCNSNLKTKTTEELEDMYYCYRDYVDGAKTAKQLKLIKEITPFEAKTSGNEIAWLTKIMFESVAKENKKYEHISELKEEIDFMHSDVDWDDILDEVYSDDDYAVELITAISNTLRFMQLVKEKLYIKVKSFAMIEDNLVIKITTSNNNSPIRVEFDIKNVIFGLYAFKEKALMQILNEEILVARIISV